MIQIAKDKLVNDKLIVAFDVDSRRQALALVNALRDLVGMFKIGSQLFTAAAIRAGADYIVVGQADYQCQGSRRIRDPNPGGDGVRAG